MLSREARQYRRDVAEVVATARRRGSCGQAALQGRLKVRLDAWMPDRRRRDLDNLRKVLMDALTHAGVWEDDSQIDDDRAVRYPPLPGSPGGAVMITIESLGKS